MRLGPFSGQGNSYKGKSVIFMMLLSTLSYAEISITTLSNWWIADFTEDTLIITKADTKRNYIGFKVQRPYCIPKAPLMLLNTKRHYSDGDTIHAQIKVDKNKPKPLTLRMTNILELERGYVTYWNLNEFPSFKQASLIEIDFKPTTELKDFSVDLAGIQQAQYQAEQICQSSVPIQEVKMEKI